MKFVLYLLMCVLDAFGALVGVSVPTKNWIIGVAIIAIVLGLYILLVFLLNKTSLNHIKVFLYAFLIVLAVIIVFCGISMIIGLFTK